MIPSPSAGLSPLMCIPRESGDDPYSVGMNTEWFLYSPRERG